MSALGYRDKAWGVNRLAATARKQGLAETAVSILKSDFKAGGIFGGVDSADEAFIRLRELTKARPPAPICRTFRPCTLASLP